MSKGVSTSIEGDVELLVHRKEHCMYLASSPNWSTGSAGTMPQSSASWRLAWKGLPYLLGLSPWRVYQWLEILKSKQKGLLTCTTPQDSRVKHETTRASGSCCMVDAEQKKKQKDSAGSWGLLFLVCYQSIAHPLSSLCSNEQSWVTYVPGGQKHPRLQQGVQTWSVEFEKDPKIHTL